MDDEIPEVTYYIPRKPKFTPYKRDHCPVCFQAYELIDNELIQSCYHPQNSNICGRCGMNNCGRNH